MTITKRYALRLIRQGKARLVRITVIDGKQYGVIDRFDLQRTDHFPGEWYLTVGK